MKLPVGGRRIYPPEPSPPDRVVLRRDTYPATGGALLSLVRPLRRGGQRWTTMSCA